jgi:hypothetical protein
LKDVCNATFIFKIFRSLKHKRCGDRGAIKRSKNTLLIYTLDG